MHRILNIAGNENNNDDLIEQPRADFIYITSVKADINIISDLIEEKEFKVFNNNIRALEISNLKTFAQIDNYFLKTIKFAKVVVLRLFGDKGTWSYGIEQLQKWKDQNVNRKLLILSGTEEEDLSLNELSSIDLNTSIKITKLLRSGGSHNYRNFLHCLTYLLSNDDKIPQKYTSYVSYPDPFKYDWKNEKGIKVGIISYKSLFLANEVNLSNELISQLREIINEYSIKGIIIGNPLNMDGSSGRSAQSVNDVSTNIDKAIDIDVCLWDERLSTVGAFNLSSQLDINVSKREKNIDQNAAAFILQGAIDFLNN